MSKEYYYMNVIKNCEVQYYIIIILRSSNAIFMFVLGSQGYSPFLEWRFEISLFFCCGYSTHIFLYERSQHGNHELHYRLKLELSKFEKEENNEQLFSSGSIPKEDDKMLEQCICFLIYTRQKAWNLGWVGRLVRRRGGWGSRLDRRQSRTATQFIDRNGWNAKSTSTGC